MTQENRLNFNWMCFNKNNGKWITSQSFHSDLLKNCHFNLSARMNNSQSIDISVRKSNSCAVDATLIAIVNGVKKSVEVSQWKNVSIIKDVTLPRQYFKNIPKSCPLAEYFLNISCTIVIHEAKKTIVNNVKILDIESVFKGQNNFEYFYLNPEFSDATIDINGTLLPVHKIIIVTKSPVFQRMFCTNMREAIENRVTIIDIKLDVMEDFLYFLYTGKTAAQYDFDSAFKLLLVADKYAVDDLKKICSSTMSKNLALNNVLLIIEFAEMSNIKELKDECMKFMVQNSKKLISKDLKEFFRQQPILAYEFSTRVFIANN